MSSSSEVIRTSKPLRHAIQTSSTAGLFREPIRQYRSNHCSNDISLSTVILLWLKQRTLEQQSWCTCSSFTISILDLVNEFLYNSLIVIKVTPDSLLTKLNECRLIQLNYTECRKMSWDIIDIIIITTVQLTRPKFCETCMCPLSNSILQHT